MSYLVGKPEKSRETPALLRGYLDWLGSENERAGLPNYTGVLMMSVGILLFIVICLVLPCVDALWHGATLDGDITVQGRGGRLVYHAIRPTLLYSSLAGIAAFLWFLSAIAYWRGWLDRYME